MVSPLSPAIVVLLVSLLVPQKHKHPSPPPAQMYKYVLAKADFAVNLRLRDLVHQFPQRLKAVEKHPLLQAFSERMRNHGIQKFSRKIKRIAQQLKRKTGKDPFKEMQYITISMQLRPEVGLANLGFKLSMEQFQVLAKKNKWKLKKQKGFTAGFKNKRWGDGWIRTPEGHILTLSSRALRLFFKQGPAMLRNPTVTQKFTKVHRAKVMLSMVLSKTDTIKKTLRRAMSLNRVSTLLQSWDTFSIQIGLQHAHFEIHTQTETVAKRTKLLFEGIRHFVHAAALSGMGLKDVFEGILDTPSMKQYGKRTRMLLKHKADLFKLMEGYIGNKMPGIQIQQRGQTTSMDVETPLNRIWLFFTLLALSA